MKHIIEDLLRAISTFGIVASLSAGAYLIATGIRPTSDDSYILGAIIGVVVAGISFISLVCRRFWKEKGAVWACVSLYSVLAAYAIFLMMTAELYGPGLAALVLGVSTLIGALELFLLRRLRPLYYDAVGLPLSAAFILKTAVETGF